MNVEPGPFLIFQPSPDRPVTLDAADGADPHKLIAYLGKRERAERAAAKAASSLAARRVHQELAQSYAASALKLRAGPHRSDDKLARIESCRSPHPGECRMPRELIDKGDR